MVTGVSRELGRRFATALSTRPDVDRVVGVDVVPPRGDIARMQFVRADIRNPVIAKVIAREDVDTVVHASVLPTSAGGRSSMKEINVIGTMQLMAACQRSATMKHFVLKSHAAVYGSSPRDPAMFTEAIAPRRPPRTGFAKDMAEVESYVRGFARRRPDVRVTVLRGAHMVGPTLESPMSAYFRLPVVPTVLGFDARLQLLHETDMLAAMQHACVTDVPGVFNIAGDGIVMLSQAIRRLGRPSVPVPSFAVGSFGSLSRSRSSDFSADHVAFLSRGRGLDTTAMRETLGFTCDYSTQEALADFGRSLSQGLPKPTQAVLGTRAEPGTVPGAVPGRGAEVTELTQKGL
ncbi:NAD-dependent epimerase/dehydratase family protein [Nocardioidaceae bacterium]|nr:NAD-dependent epimerase/dehydratase family protein [Nocardioidaceae bacterium]